MKDCIASHDESSGIQIFYSQKQTDKQEYQISGTVKSGKKLSSPSISYPKFRN